VRVNFGERQGSYVPWWKTVEVVIYDWPSVKANAMLSGVGAPLQMSYDAVAHALHVLIPDVADQGELRVGD